MDNKQDNNYKGIEVSPELLKETMEFLILEDKTLIGKLISLPDGSLAFTDIRRGDFSRLILQNGNPLPDIPLPANLPEVVTPDSYYRFSWLLRSADNDTFVYGFQVDPSGGFRLVTAQDVVEMLKEQIRHSSPASRNRDVRMIETLQSQLTASGKEIFIYELLQNANDNPLVTEQGKQPVRVEFHLLDRYLVFMHSGAPFNESNVAAICDISAQEKSSDPDKIGYKGIGFKTIFVISNYVYLSSGPFHFRFDQNCTRKYVSMPFQLLPIWTPPEEVPAEVGSLFSRSEQRFPVQFAIRPKSALELRQGEQNFSELLRKVFENERIILFIPNLHSLKVCFHDPSVEDIVLTKDSGKWQVNSYKEPLKPELVTKIQRDIDRQREVGTMKIPDKYKDFHVTTVSFACGRDGVNLLPVSNATLFCYLPAKKASWGLPFLMNTDMIPTGLRNDVEDDLDLNREIAYIAGQKFFQWISELSVSGDYQVDSVFRLIPDFDKIAAGRSEGCRKLIMRFQDGFEDRLFAEPLIPVRPGELAKLTDTWLDTTGLLAGGTMSDTDFSSLICNEGALPVPELRADRAFNAFQQRYLSKFRRSRQVIGKEKLLAAVKTCAFHQWLKTTDNNIRFIEFLLNKYWLGEFAGCQLFLDPLGDLNSARFMWHDAEILDKLSYLTAFDDRIRHFSREFVDHFKENSQWHNQTKDLFKPLDPTHLVFHILLYASAYADTFKKLEDRSTSRAFFAFLAKYVSLKDVSDSVRRAHVAQLRSLPFFSIDYTEDGTAVEGLRSGFNGVAVFVPCDEARVFRSRPWVASDWISFVSPLYDEETVRYFKEYLGVCVYSDKVAVDTFIRPTYRQRTVNGRPVVERSKPVYSEAINEACADLHSSLDFVSFCLQNKNNFSEGELTDYVLHTYNGSGKAELVTDNDCRFFPNGLFPDLATRSWIHPDWMYAIHPDYLDVSNDSGDLRSFFSSAFHVQEFTGISFFRQVVLPNLEDIFCRMKIPVAEESQADNEDYVRIWDGKRKAAIARNVDFIRYVDAHLSDWMVDSGTLPDALAAIPLNDGTANLSSDDLAYFPCAELRELLAQPWFPCDAGIRMVNPEYGESSYLRWCGVRVFTFSTFFDEVIVGRSSYFRKALSDFTNNRMFHAWIISKRSSLSVEQLLRLADFQVFVLDAHHPDETVLRPLRGEYVILDDRFNDLLDNGLLGNPMPTVLHPVYRADVDFTTYWGLFGHRRFSTDEFIGWVVGQGDDYQNLLLSGSHNLQFWRWIKTHALHSSKLPELGSLPVHASNKSGHELGYVSPERGSVYLSDTYSGISGQAEFIRGLYPDAWFVLDCYHQSDGSSSSLSEWVTLWEAIGVRTEIVSILEGMLDKLFGIRNEALLSLYAEHAASLRVKVPDLATRLGNLQIRTSGGEYFLARSVLLIDTDASEPFPDVDLPNSLSVVGKGAVRELLLDIARSAGSTVVKDVGAWRLAKLKRYLDFQDRVAGVIPSDDDDDFPLLSEFPRIQLALFADLAALLRDNKEAFEPLKPLLKRVLVYGTGGNLVSGESLRLGTIYHPLCDFQANGVTDLPYLSDCYAPIPDIVPLLVSVFSVVGDFTSDDVKHLAHRPFALYFWEKYLESCPKASQSRIVKLVKSGDLDRVPCIPTASSVKRPDELYWGDALKDYVQCVNNVAEKVPAVADIVFSDEKGTVSLFGQLPFRTERLDLADCFSALPYVTKKKLRPRLLTWLAEQFDASNPEHIRLREDYREHANATWFNGANNECFIYELYALDKPDGRLSHYFRSHSMVFNVGYFPSDNETYAKVCECLDLQVIHDNEQDMKVSHVALPDSTDSSPELVTRLRQMALLAAGVENIRDWKSRYEGYEQKINPVRFIACKYIELYYVKDPCVNDRTRRFYHPTGSGNFYYVNRFNDPRLFADLVGEIKAYMGFKVDKEKLLDWFYSPESMEDELKRNNELKTDAGFMAAMKPFLKGDVTRFAGRIAEERQEIPAERPMKQAKVIHAREETPTLPESYESEVESPEVITMDEEISVPSVTVSDSIGLQTSPITVDDRVLQQHAPAFNPGIQEPLQLRVDKTVSEAERSRLSQILGRAMDTDTILNENYLVRMRFFDEVVRTFGKVDQSEQDFIRSKCASIHTLDGKYIHRCSARGGTLFISPFIWNQLRTGQGVVCFYYGKFASQFTFIESLDELKRLIDRDAIVIQVTGNEKGELVNRIYEEADSNKYGGNVYTLIRTVKDEELSPVFQAGTDIPAASYNNDEIDPDLF